MRITLGQLRRIIREEVQREARGHDRYDDEPEDPFSRGEVGEDGMERDPDAKPTGRRTGFNLGTGNPKKSTHREPGAPSRVKKGWKPGV